MSNDKKTLKELYNDIQNFVEGQVNSMKDDFNLLNEDMKLLAEERQYVCLDCEELNLEEEKCNNCGCSFPELTYAKDKKCPLKKW